ncbi:hypothetical protein Hamer_G005857, partial [Homarus americanus]
CIPQTHLWIDNVWSRRPGGLHKERSLLVWDMFRAYLTDKVKKHLQQNNIVTASWEAVRVETVVKSLKKCGISNAMDGEDDLLWRDSDEEEDGSKYNEDEVGSSSDSDPYADLFMLDDEQPADFEGF